MAPRWLARGVPVLAGAAGAASVLACWLEAPLLLRPSAGVALVAPWLSVAAAVGAGALVLREEQGRTRQATRDGGVLVGPDVAALGLGPVLVGVATWFVVACGLPLALTAWAGERRLDTLHVVARANRGAFACRYPLVLAGGPLARPEAVCVDDDTWARAAPGDDLLVEVRRGPLALELRAAGPQPGRKSNGYVVFITSTSFAPKSN